MRIFWILCLPTLVFGLGVRDVITPNKTSSSLIFQSKALHPLKIQTLRLYFLGASSCYEKFMAKQELDVGQNVLVWNQDEQLGLSHSGLYQALLETVGAEDIEKVASVLMRIRTEDKQWIRFLGSCQDQQDNCCVPIHCHPSVAECVPEMTDGLQYVN